MGLSLLLTCAVMMTSCEPSAKSLSAHHGEETSRSAEEPTGIFTEKASRAEREPPPAKMHKVTIIDTITSSEVMYAQVRSGEGDYWLSFPRQTIVRGDTYLHGEGVRLRDFHSKSLNRTFPTLHMVKHLLPAKDENRIVSNSGNLSVKLPSKGAIDIHSLVHGSRSYSGQKVTLVGRVTKVNKDIMDMHWVHLQDGTHDDYDLVITMPTSQEVNVGEEIAVSGTVSLDRDFGAGYAYDLIIENGMLLN